MAEWSNAPDSKSGIRVSPYREFKSLFLRQNPSVFFFSLLYPAFFAYFWLKGSLKIKVHEKALLETLSEYCQLGIPQQLDYSKFNLYSIITHSTVIEGSTVTEVKNQLLFDEGITSNKKKSSRTANKTGGTSGLLIKKKPKKLFDTR